MLQRIESFIRERNLIEPAGEVTVLVSGGADSTCLWHALRELGYRVSALHVAHGLRGAESDEDARFCREAFDAEVVEATGTADRGGAARRALRRRHRSAARDGPHRLRPGRDRCCSASSRPGRPQRIKAKREDGVVRPLLGLWREETRAYCEAHRLAVP